MAANARLICAAAPKIPIIADAGKHSAVIVRGLVSAGPVEPLFVALLASLVFTIVQIPEGVMLSTYNELSGI